MTRDPFARWMALAFPWITPDGTLWPRLEAAFNAGRDGEEPISRDSNAMAAWRAGMDSAK